MTGHNCASLLEKARRSQLLIFFELMNQLMRSREADTFKNATKRSRQHARIHRRLSSNERTHTRGGHTHNVTQQTDTHIFSEGGRHPQCNPTNGHTYFHSGGDTHNVTKQTDTHIFKEGGDATTM